MYRLLAVSSLPAWERTTVYFADDRAVPRDHPESNYRLVRETLLERAGIPGDRVHPMIPERWDAPLEEADPASALERLDPIARAYADALPPRLDLILLGLGRDGHTASLFPGAAALDERERRVLAVEGPTAPRFRLTITPPEIARARLVVVLVRGREKREALRKSATPGSAVDVPGRLANRGIWLVDRDAIGSTDAPGSGDGAP